MNISIIACRDVNKKNFIIKNITEINPKMEFKIVENEEELFDLLGQVTGVTVYFDKSFFGLRLKEKLNHVRSVSSGANIVFIETGECPVFFGMRLHKLGVNSFICGIENPDDVREPLRKVFAEENYYPDNILWALDDIDIYSERKKYSEVTEREEKVAFYKSQGKSLKEISQLLDNIVIGTISTHMSRFYAKTGCKNMRDLIALF